MALLKSEQKEWNKILRVAKRNNIFVQKNDIGKVSFGDGGWHQLTANTTITPLQMIKAKARILRSKR